MIRCSGLALGLCAVQKLVENGNVACINHVSEGSIIMHTYGFVFWVKIDLWRLFVHMYGFGVARSVLGKVPLSQRNNYDLKELKRSSV